LRAQLAGLLERGYRPLHLTDILRTLKNGEPVRGGTFAVSFDDGYANNFHHAWPILKELRIPATIFVATAYLDSREPFPFDDWPAAGGNQVPAETWLPLTTAQCQEMLSGGLVDLGAHTHTHEDFRGRPQEFQRNLQTSLEVLRCRFGISQATFAFPFGFAEVEMVEAARHSGVVCALTTQTEVVASSSDPFCMGRFSVSQSDTAGTLAAKIDGWYTHLRNGWRLAMRMLPSRSRNHLEIAESSSVSLARMCVDDRVGSA
jgi:peptidoglycan/xylan/chitin deacetylase (PgdA/CDA1 family)